MIASEVFVPARLAGDVTDTSTSRVRLGRLDTRVPYLIVLGHMVLLWVP